MQRSTGISRRPFAWSVLALLLGFQFLVAIAIVVEAPDLPRRAFRLLIVTIWLAMTLGLLWWLATLYQQPHRTRTRVLACAFLLALVLIVANSLLIYADPVLFFLRSGDVPSINPAFDDIPLRELSYGLAPYFMLYTSLVLVLFGMAIRRWRVRLPLLAGFVVLWLIAQGPLLSRFQTVFDLNSNALSDAIQGGVFVAVLATAVLTILLLPFGALLHWLLKSAFGAVPAVSDADAGGVEPPQRSSVPRRLLLAAALLLALGGLGGESAVLYTLTPQAVHAACLRAQPWPGAERPYCQSPY